LETVAGIDALLPLDDGPCETQRDADVEIMELPHALRMTLATLPNSVPYIHINAGRNRGEHGHRPRVGLVWQSGSWDSSRSIAPELMEKLTQIKHIHFSLLQRGPGLASWRGTACARPIMADIR